MILSYLCKYLPMSERLSVYLLLSVIKITRNVSSDFRESLYDYRENNLLIFEERVDHFGFSMQRY